MITVLYVDDEPSLLEIAKAFLEREGDISVETSSSAMDALVRIETRHFDAIICDYQMPVVDGIKFLKTIRMQGRNTPFILFTGKGREDVAIEALNNGADFYLQKGGDPKAQFTELVNMLKRSIEQRTSAERLKESEEVYERLFHDNVEAMVLVDPKSGAIADVNNAATAFYGYTREQMLAMNIADTYPDLRPDQLANMGHVEVGRGVKMIMPNRLANGEIREVEVFSGMLRIKGRPLGYAIIHDITEMRRAQRREERSNRIFKVVSITSQLTLHAHSEIELLEGTARALVESGGYLCAWIGHYGHSSSSAQEVVRSQRAGPDAFGGRFPIEEGKLINLSSQVFEKKETVVEKVSRPNIWPTSMNGKGEASHIALPLRVGGALRGVMIIGSNDLDALEDSELFLLQELADSLSESISIISSREGETARLDEKVAMAADFSEILRAMPNGGLILDKELRITRLNPRAMSILGRRERELLGEGILDVLPEARGSPLEKALKEASSRGGLASIEYLVPGSDPRWYRISILSFGIGIGLVFDDITEKREAEQGREREKELLHQMIETSPAGIVVISDKGEITFANRHAERVLGLSRNTITGITYNAPEWRISDMNGAPLKDEDLPFAVVMRTGEPVWDARHAVEPVPGMKRFLSISATPFKDVDGRVLGVVATVQDITDSIKAEEARISSDSLLHELMGSALDVIVKLDQEGKVLFVSSAVRNLVGKEPEALIGREVVDFVHPDDLERLLKAFQEATESKETMTVRFRLRKGEEFIMVEAVGRIQNDEKGEPSSIVGSVRDITSRQMAEDKLWETGSKLRAIIQTSPMAIVSLDANGVINTWNPAAERVFGWGNVDSVRPFPFLPEEETERTRMLKGRILAGEMLTDIEIRHKGKDDREHHTSISTAPILDQSGKVASIILVASDVTERKAMEDRLVQLNDLLRLVNRILRHDTLNELMVLSGSLDMYQKTKQERFLVTASKAVYRSMEMIKRMKELESLAASGGSMKVYDLRQTVENVLRGYMVEFSVDGEGSIFADDALPSAIDNIVRNAMIHGKADFIEARIWVDEGNCYLRIADNGIGIPDQVKRRIFEEGFSYGSNAGTGLGLYLVTRAVERYRGKVMVEDNQPKGAAFVLIFPKA